MVVGGGNKVPGIPPPVKGRSVGTYCARHGQYAPKMATGPPGASPDMRHWALDRSIHHLNHGSYGATPISVLGEQRRLRDLLEANPTGFFEDLYPDAVTDARTQVAAFVRADPAGLVLLPSVTAGVAAVLASVGLGRGDEILVTDHGYNACRNIVEVAANRSGATVTVARLDFPGSDPDQVVAGVLDRVSQATRLVVVDHVTSRTALVLPVARIVDALEPHVPVLVDGAHTTGMLDLDVRALGASFTCGSLHKWACAPKGSAWLAVADRHRDRVTPAIISHGWNRMREGTGRLQRLFDWTGTFDPSAWLSVPRALEVIGAMRSGGWPAVMADNRDLALAARNLLCDRLGLDQPAPDDMVGAMVAVPIRWPIADLWGRLRHLGFVTLAGAWPAEPAQLLRVSSHLYTGIEEYDRLADAILALGAEHG